MPDSPTSQPEPDFVCSCEDWMRLSCRGFPKWGAREGQNYCVFHFPNDKPMAAFMHAFQEKLDSADYNFAGFRFPPDMELTNLEFEIGAYFDHALFMGDVSFQNVVFKDEAEFIEATFVSDVNMMNASFGKRAMFFSAHFRGCADFSTAVFAGHTDFANATFDGVAVFNTEFKGNSDFMGSTFHGYADFAGATFNEDVTFSGSTFNSTAEFGSAEFKSRAHFNNSLFGSDVSFNSATFGSLVEFNEATFRSYARFSGKQNRPMFGATASLSFEFVKIDHPDRLSFHSVVLRPSWFANVTLSKFEFLDVTWRFRFDDEIKRLTERGVSSPHIRLSKIFRDFAINCEENHRYPLASRFRYWAMDTNRRTSSFSIQFWKLSWWYWLASGYGELAPQAFVMLLVVWLAAAGFYTKVGFARWEPKGTTDADIAVTQRDEVGTPLKLRRALTYSAGVMTLQKPEPRPATTAAQTIVLLETILGPVQAALLALAIRRKFMQ